MTHSIIFHFWAFVSIREIFFSRQWNFREKFFMLSLITLKRSNRSRFEQVDNEAHRSDLEFLVCTFDRILELFARNNQKKTPKNWPIKAKTKVKRKKRWWINRKIVDKVNVSCVNKMHFVVRCFYCGYHLYVSFTTIRKHKNTWEII